MKKNLLFYILFVIPFFGNTQTVLTQNTMYNIQSGNAPSCSTSGIISENRFLRRFVIDSFPSIIDTAFLIKVRVGVEACNNGPYKVGGSVYELNGGMFFSNMILMSSDTVDAYQDSTKYFLDIYQSSGYVLPGMTIVGELYAPQDTSVSFYPGSNFYWETDSSYIAADGCGIFQPTTYDAIGFPNTHLLIDVWVNQRPGFTDFSVTGFKDLDYNFMKTDFADNFSDNDGDTISSVVIKTLPANGDLYLYGNPVATNDTIWSYQMDSLIYTPNAGFTGSDVFAIRARDNFHSTYALHIVTINVVNWAVGLDEENAVDLSVYPNPAGNFIQIDQHFNVKQVAISNMNGDIVYQSVMNDNTIDVSILAPGTYIIQALTDEGIVESRFVKQ